MEKEQATDDEISIEDAVAVLMAELPRPVQEFILSEERNRISADLSQKYRLHADQAGVFDESYMFMLLGTLSPDAFMTRLVGAGIPTETVRALANDVNEQVFIPLRIKEQQGEPAGRIPVAATKPEPLPPPALDYQPAAPLLPGSDVPVPLAPAPPPVPVQLNPAPPPIPAGVPQALEASPVPAPQQHAVQAMPGAAHPGWHPAAAVHIYVPTQGPHMQSHAAPSPAPAPVTDASIQSAPAYTEPQQVYVPPPTPAAAPAPYVPPVAATPITKSYPADPYREPIE